MAQQISRRDLLNGVVGISIGTYVVAYALPIGLEEMFQVTSRGLEIKGDNTYTIKANTTEDYTYVSWLDSGAQLALESGSTLEFKT